MEIENTYKLLPLEWNGSSTYKSAGTAFGSYRVYCDDYNNWEWGYCFDEYYDEEKFSVDSMEEGMEAAWEHWVSRITTALIKQ